MQTKSNWSNQGISTDLGCFHDNKKRYDSGLPYQRPDLIEVMEIEIDLTTYQFL